MGERHRMVHTLEKSLQSNKKFASFEKYLNFFLCMYCFTHFQMVFSIVKHVLENSGQTPGSKTDDISSSKLPDQKHKDIHVKSSFQWKLIHYFQSKGTFFPPTKNSLSLKCLYCGAYMRGCPLNTFLVAYSIEELNWHLTSRLNVGRTPL